MPATCISCGAELGQPHGPNCEFSHHAARASLRGLAVTVLTAVLLGLAALAAPAASADSCRIWHGEDYCRRAAQAPIPMDTTVGPKPPPRKCTARTRQDPGSNGPCGFVDQRGRRWA